MKINKIKPTYLKIQEKKIIIFLHKNSKNKKTKILNKILKNPKPIKSTITLSFSPLKTTLCITSLFVKKTSLARSLKASILMNKAHKFLTQTLNLQLSSINIIKARKKLAIIIIYNNKINLTNKIHLTNKINKTND
jgi:hypothetical protein